MKSSRNWGDGEIGEINPKSINAGKIFLEV